MGGQTSSSNQTGSGYIRYSGDPYRDDMVSIAARDYGRARSFADLIAGGRNYGAARNYGKPVTNPTPKPTGSGPTPQPHGGTPIGVQGGGQSAPSVLGGYPGRQTPAGGSGQGSGGSSSGEGSSGGGGGGSEGQGDAGGRGGSRMQKTFSERIAGIRLGPGEDDDPRYRGFVGG